MASAGGCLPGARLGRSPARPYLLLLLSIWPAPPPEAPAGGKRLQEEAGRVCAAFLPLYLEEEAGSAHPSHQSPSGRTPGAGCGEQSGRLCGSWFPPEPATAGGLEEEPPPSVTASLCLPCSWQRGLETTRPCCRSRGVRLRLHIWRARFRVSQRLSVFIYWF